MNAHFWWQVLGAVSVIAVLLIGGAMIDLIPWLRDRASSGDGEQDA